MAGFVIEYNRRTRVSHVTEFATIQQAVQYRLKLEEQRTDRNIEIVALSAKSLDVIKQTHSRYFFGELLGQALNPPPGTPQTIAPAAPAAADRHGVAGA